MSDRVVMPPSAAATDRRFAEIAGRGALQRDAEGRFFDGDRYIECSAESRRQIEAARAKRAARAVRGW